MPLAMQRNILIDLPLSDFLPTLGATALNEPRRVKCGAPDFIVSQGEIVIGHLEAKDLHVPIRGMKDANKDQQDRYRAALPNLIYSNGLDWDFYRDSELLASVTIAELAKGIVAKPDQYSTLENLLRDFISQKPQTITSPKDLAERMAGKANLIKDVLRNTLRDDADFQTELAAQYQAFKVSDVSACGTDLKFSRRRISGSSQPLRSEDEQEIRNIEGRG